MLQPEEPLLGDTAAEVEVARGVQKHHIKGGVEGGKRGLGGKGRGDSMLALFPGHTHKLPRNDAAMPAYWQ